ncbi:MAG: 50S ribosomal protein L2 [Candidatus Micrarchaeota archaeon]|nr:50S ribosomal protein L2 [Candidatus Micrarchaeota archaeon]
MGKLLHQQRRGKGSVSYKAPNHRYKAEIQYRLLVKIEKEGMIRGAVSELIDDPGHQTGLMSVHFTNGEDVFLPAPEGIAIGDEVYSGVNAPLTRGSCLPLGKMPDGAYVFNLERAPGDGGKLARAPGSYAVITSREKNIVYVKMPSRQTLELQATCRAQLGIACGGGRLEKPLLKAGANFYKKHAQNRKWPVNRGVHMAAYNHPFGGKQHHKGRGSATSRGAPPGRKVGHIAASSVGRRKSHVMETNLERKNNRKRR